MPLRWHDYLELTERAPETSCGEETPDAEATEEEAEAAEADTGDAGAWRKSARVLGLGLHRAEDWRRQCFSLATKTAPLALLFWLVGGHWLLPDAWRRVRGRQGLEDLVDDYLLRGWEPAYISWATHPEKCWDIYKYKDGPAGWTNGMKLHIWDCSDKPAKFLVPAGGFGLIRVADHPEFCLDAVGKSDLLQFWKCTEAPRVNLLFSVPTGREGGLVKPANDDRKCVDIPGGNDVNGNHAQQWLCDGAPDSNMLFVIHWPVTCKWGEWSEWSNCSSTCMTMRRRKQRVEEGDPSSKECDGEESQVNSCHPKECSSDNATLDSRQGGQALAGANTSAASKEPAGANTSAVSKEPAGANTSAASKEHRGGCVASHPARALALALLGLGALQTAGE